MKPRILHQRLIAVAIGVSIAVLVVAATRLMLPSQSATNKKIDYGYVYSGAKSSSAQFVLANMRDDSLLMLGSSEFSTPASTVAQVPAQVFGTTNYGVKPMLVGEAFDQALWHTIALGSLSRSKIPRNKVVLVVSLGEYTDGGLDNASFKERFSFSLYRGFCSNANITPEVRDYVLRRLVEQGIDETTLRAAESSDPIAAIDTTVLSFMDDLRLRGQLGDVRSQGIPMAEGMVANPNWYVLRQEALQEAMRRSTTNEWGAEDGFWTRELEPALPKLKDARAGETYTKTPEYEDLNMFLTLCDLTGIEPLVVIEPCMGPYYDYIGITVQTRASAYQRIRDVVTAHPTARLADFSDREYEKYFLFDIVHFGWTGWIDAERAIYDFALNNTPAQQSFTLQGMTSGVLG